MDHNDVLVIGWYSHVNILTQMILSGPGEIVKNREIAGNKAYNLARMQQAGLPVPGFVVIPYAYFQTTDNAGNITSKITRILGEGYYAVRSSSVLEDGTSHSFAGLFQSFLYVKADNLSEKITQVYNSSSTERVKVYMQSRGITGQPHVSVIVQKMVDASVSGVVFGVHPVTGKEGTIVINSVYGLGEGLVSGALDADTFIVEENAVSSQIITKKEAYFLTVEGQVSRQPVKDETQTLPSLEHGQVTELAANAKKLHSLFGAPQDIEFCYDNRKLYLVQSRPVTVIQPKDEEEYIIWDNSNIIESYPGVTTPLTFSFINKVYEAVYTQFVIFMGVPAKEALGHKDIFSNMVGLLNGRVYYNLLSWYKTLAMLPGYTINAGFMEKMMGVKEKFTLKQPPKNKTAAWLRLAVMVPRTIYNLVTLEKQKKKFLEKLNTALKEYEDKEYQHVAAAKIVADFEALEKILVNEWKAPLVNDFFTMIYFGLLQKVTAPAGASLHNDLLCGNNDIISAEPARRISAMVQAIRGNEALNAIVRNFTTGE
ncbi:MAG TPA: PEP/pyruvate-binding domain-containing protein, partial [Bacteroidia bacterium]|nr:PEP/pyruvate-binding domain-containing protein [Bacteroidia bacterium]